MSDIEVSAGGPWKSNAEITHAALALDRSGIPVNDLSDKEVLVAYQGLQQDGQMGAWNALEQYYGSIKLI